MSKLAELREIKKSNPAEFKQLVSELSTDEEGASGKLEKIRTIDFNYPKDQLVGDKWGNSKLSLAMEQHNFDAVKEICSVKGMLSDSELLQKIAMDMKSSEIKNQFSIDDEVASTLYSEARDQLTLLGEYMLGVDSE